jgi:thymidylate synthase (FAD)
VLPEMWYVPEVVGGKAANKKQGQEDNLDPSTQHAFRVDLREQCSVSYALYQSYIAAGVAPEHARMFLHLNHYVHWIGSVNLGNLFKFLRLRDHSHAQIEAQMYARAIIELLDPHLPGLMGLFKEIVRK